jgi:hypothetical protein
MLHLTLFGAVNPTARAGRGRGTLMAKKKNQGLDLWMPVVPADKQHNNFRGICEHGSQACRDVISSWADGFRDRDGKFVREFQTTFDSSFWELYLFACFKQLKLKPKLEHAAPDFMLRIGKSDVAVEATVAKEAEGHRPEWDKYDLVKSRDIADLAQRVRYTTVRLASRFVSKVREYRDKYAALPHVKGEPFILCIAPFDQPFTFDLAQQAMRRVLYRADTPIFRRDPKTGEAVIFGVSEVDAVTKDAGAEVPLGMFCDDSYAEVSAVLFSTTATWGKVRAMSSDPEMGTVFRAERYNGHGTIPLVTVAQKPQYRETLLDGLILCLNPFAAHPIDIEPFLSREIALESWHQGLETYVSETPHEWLIRRFCFTAKAVPELSPPPTQLPRNYKKISVPVWPEGELRLVPVTMWPAVDQHMAHVKGWTAVVFRDAVDDAWEAIAIDRIVHTIPEFREKNDDDAVATVTAINDYASRDEAFEAIKVAIQKYKPRRRRGGRD